MEQPTPVSAVSSESVTGHVSSNGAIRNIQQEYLEQWHLLENLQSDLASDAHSDDRQESTASLQNSTISNANIQDAESTGYQQEKVSTEEWFVLGEDPVGVSPDVPSGDEEIIAKGNSASETNAQQDKQSAKQQLSPYSEQWYELEQLKASVRSLSHAAGLTQSPHPLPDDSETLASGLSSGSVSVEALDKVGLEGTSAEPHGETIQAGSMMMGMPQEADDIVEQVEEEDPGDSGTSFSMDGSGAEDKEIRNRWFPLRPSAVGEDDEDTNQVTYTATAAAAAATHHFSSDRLQGVSHAWSDDDAKQTPPERSQPDGRDGPDLKRTPWMASTYMSRQQTGALPAQNVPLVSSTAGSKDSGSDTSLPSQPQNDDGDVTPPAQNFPLVSGRAESKDSGSDTSLLSQPLNENGNVTPLDIITRSVPSLPKGASLISELKHRHAPQLNSDSDTESPVSKLLGPNFRAVQQVLDRLKQDRLSDSVSDNADDPAFEQQSLREESLQSLTSTGSKAHGTEWSAVQPGVGIKTHPPSEAVTSYEMPPSRPNGMLYSSHTEVPQGNIHSRDESHRSLSLNAIDTSRKSWEPAHASSWTSARLSYLDPPETTPTDTTPQLVIPATIVPSQDHSSPSITSVRIAGEESRPSSGHSSERLFQHDSSQSVPPALLQSPYKYSTEQRPRSSIDLSLRSSRIAWGERTASDTNMNELLHPKDRSANTVLPSSAHKQRLHELSPHSSLGSTIQPFRRAWAESTQIPTSPTARELSTGDPNEMMSSVTPADNLIFPGHTSSGLVDDAKVAALNVDATLSSVGEKSHDSNRTGRGHREPLPHERASDRSASSDDTDDLLTYEPVFEGDRQYLQMQRRAKRSGSKQRQSDAVELHGSRLPVRTTRDIETGTRMSGQEQPLSMMQGQEGIQGTPVDLNDSQIKAIHWSLGAGTISPISFDSAAQLDSQLGKSSTPLGPTSERSSVREAGALQEQSLEEDDTTTRSEDRDRAPFKQPQSHSTTEVSSSDEIYRPVLYGDGNKENRPDESAFQTTSYGIYDIRRSSGPGSTNRRRKALGLHPNPTREAVSVSQEANGLVYISGSSTPSSVQDVRGGYLRREDDPTERPTSYREPQPYQQYYERITERTEELRKPRTKDHKQEKQAHVPKARQARDGHGKRDFQDPYQDEYLPREDRRSDRSHRRQTHVASRKDSPASNGSPEPEKGQLHHSSDRSRQPSVPYIDRTDPNRTSHSLGHSKRSVSSGKSKSRFMEDGLASLSQQARLEKKTGSRKHHLETSASKAGHSSRDKSDFRSSKTSRLDDNISKLSSLISRSLDESLSSSSQTSTTVSRRPTSKGKKAKMSSSTSETSDVSEFFNYAFFEPRFRQSIGQKMKLRELLRSVKSRDISPIVRRARDSTSPESTSTVSSNDGRGAERDQPPRVEREPPPALTEPRRSETVAGKPFFTSKLPAAEPKCTCSRKVVTQATSPGINRYSREDDDDRVVRMPQRRDVGVNFPTPAVTRRQSYGSDETPRAQMEDASTQTGEVTSTRKVSRKIDTEPEKLPPKPTKSRRNIEEHGVISQPSPPKSDYQYVTEQRDKRKPKERLVASQNSPDHSIKSSTDWRNRTQEPAWFHPLTSKPQTEQRTTMQLNTTSKSRTRDELRVDAFDSLVNSSSSLQKLTLQEAFLYARPQFVRRSRDRVARIEEAAREKERRKMIAEAAREENEREVVELKTKTPPSTPKPKTRVKSDQVFMPKPRQMTRAEIKELNKRLYKNLPEVKAKNEEKKRLAFYRTNRLRAQLYDKRVRNRLKGAGN
ncbi:uncharacterized protein LOC144642757 isoform X1 [Oculina patagonica]